MKSYRAKIDIDADGRYDVTPIFTDRVAFKDLINDLIEPFLAMEFDYVVGIDDIGFVIGTAIAQKLDKGFVTVRRTDRTDERASQETFVDWYGDIRTLELRKDAIEPGAKVLVIDDWVETGQQIRATLKMLSDLNIETVGISAIHAHRNNETDDLFEYHELHSALVEVE